MRRSSPKPDLHGPRATAIVGLGLIVATAFAALLVTAIASRAAQPVAAPLTACSPNDRGRIWPQQLRGGGGTELVPPGARRVTVCGYNGMNATQSTPQFGLTSAGRAADRRAVRGLTAQLDALRPTHGVRSCPMDQSSDELVTFSYASGPPVVVTVDTGGCNAISNGHIRRLGLGKPLVRRIAALAKPISGQRWATVAGHLRLCGGPYPGRCFIESFGNGDRVVVHGHGEPWLAMAQMHRGRFRFRVAGSGAYMLDFYADNTLVAKEQRQLTPGQTTHVVFLIPMP